ncbi:c-type cytochrome domain-containing protein [Gimesia chilikensis]|uniref:c-type cytochrome domain-containing protein n=1 Tax=Gimesia chilikensis TaxID=2605989 RepID=UPI003A8F4DEE
MSKLYCIMILELKQFIESSICVALFTFMILLTNTVSAQKAINTSEDAKNILLLHCNACHESSSNSNKMSTSLEELITVSIGSEKSSLDKLVVPGKPEESELWRRINLSENDDDFMPQDGEKLSKNELDKIKKWILEGAKPYKAQRSFISNQQIERAIRTDFEVMRERNPRALPFIRYFTLTHLHNDNKLPDELIETYRSALRKAVNSLSWAVSIKNPIPIKYSEETIYRIDIRDYSWDQFTWSAIESKYPYTIDPIRGLIKVIAKDSSSQFPIIRGDWFVYEGVQPPLYHTILKLPHRDADLETLLGVNVINGVLNDNIMRSGFRNSGVSLSNRMIERHPALYGAYWKSYDFGKVQNPPDDRDLFISPLGPKNVAEQLAKLRDNVVFEQAFGVAENKDLIPNLFVHNGGEIIFNLPNGLQGYLLVNAEGVRIDNVEARQEIVVDRFPGVNQIIPEGILNGISCMRCHWDGIKDKEDEIRGHANRINNLNSIQRDIIKSIYSPHLTFTEYVGKDTKRFNEALKKAVAEANSEVSEPIYRAFSNFKVNLSKTQFLLELGVNPSDQKTVAAIHEVITTNDDLGSFLPLFSNGTVSRELFEAKIETLFKALGNLIPGDFFPLVADKKYLNPPSGINFDLREIIPDYLRNQSLDHKEMVLNDDGALVYSDSFFSRWQAPAVAGFPNNFTATLLVANGSDRVSLNSGAFVLKDAGKTHTAKLTQTIKIPRPIKKFEVFVNGFVNPANQKVGDSGGITLTVFHGSQDDRKILGKESARPGHNGSFSVRIEKLVEHELIVEIEMKSVRGGKYEDGKVTGVAACTVRSWGVREIK